MDIGLGKFLEMFEERFGKPATTVLVALIALGVAAFCVRLIWANLVEPIGTSFGRNVSRDDAESLLWNFMLSLAVGGVVFSAIWFGFFRSRISSVRKRLDALMARAAEMDETFEQVKAESEANRAELGSIRKDLDADKERFESAVAEAREHVAALTKQGYKVPPALQALADEEF